MGHPLIFALKRDGLDSGTCVNGTQFRRFSCLWVILDLAMGMLLCGFGFYELGWLLILRCGTEQA